MIINHNMASLNTYRQLSTNNANGAKSLEKLSSGLRINKAGDDAAGLAISEKMRGQIRGLDQAARNSQDAISMIQTAEGSLSETHNILQRMRELAVQGSNDTLTTSDRTEIQKEMNALTSETNRIGNATEFNTKKLLDGGTTGSAEASGSKLTGGVAAAGANQAVYTITPSGALLATEDISFDFAGDSYSFNAVPANGGLDTDATNFEVGTNLATQLTELASAMNQAFTANGKNTDWVAAATATTITITAQGAGTAADAAGNAQLSNFAETSGAQTATATQTTTGTAAQLAAKASGTISFTNNNLASGSTITINDETYSLYDSSKAEAAPSGAGVLAIDIKDMNSSEDLIDAIVAGGTPTGITLTKVDSVTLKAEASATGTAANAFALSTSPVQGSQDKFSADLQIGANKGQSMTIDINDMRSRALGISSLAGTSSSVTIEGVNYDVAWSAKGVTDGTNNTNSEAGLSVASHADAGKAIEVLDAAIKKVSGERSKLGAFQNRLEHTITNLGTSSENMTAAESRVRDVDMAKEMMQFQKNNILSQAATAMLAQANQAPQGVLQLLR